VGVEGIISVAVLKLDAVAIREITSGSLVIALPGLAEYYCAIAVGYNAVSLTGILDDVIASVRGAESLGYQGGART